MAGRRIINLEGGTYNERVEGNSVQISGNTIKTGEDSSPNEESSDKKEPRNITSEAEVINTEGRSYTENQNGTNVERVE